MKYTLRRKRRGGGREGKKEGKEEEEAQHIHSKLAASEVHVKAWKWFAKSIILTIFSACPPTAGRPRISGLRGDKSLLSRSRASTEQGGGDGEVAWKRRKGDNEEKEIEEGNKRKGRKGKIRMKEYVSSGEGREGKNAREMERKSIGRKGRKRKRRERHIGET